MPAGLSWIRARSGHDDCICVYAHSYIYKAVVTVAETPAQPEEAVARCELYRLLSDPVRVRLLGLAAAEELAVGELAELLREGQPKISRHAAALR